MSMASLVVFISLNYSNPQPLPSLKANIAIFWGSWLGSFFEVVLTTSSGQNFFLMWCLRTIWFQKSSAPEMSWPKPTLLLSCQLWQQQQISLFYWSMYRPLLLYKQRTSATLEPVFLSQSQFLETGITVPNYAVAWNQQWNCVSETEP